jgi:NTE family protein
MGSDTSKTVSLVLGSGGARGLAHIGVINWLTENGYRIESVSGASMGALVGGIFAAGKLNTYTEWVKALEKSDVLRFLDLSFGSGGLFKGDRIMDILKDMVGEHAIEDLPVSFTAVATDIDRQREVWFTEGPLFDAIRASIAVPSIFTPHEYLGMTLLDGGLLNPVPIAPTFHDRTDITIAVDLNARRRRSPAVAQGEPGQPAKESLYRKLIDQFLDTWQGGSDADNDAEQKGDIGLFDLLARAFDTMQNAISAVKLAAYAPDIVIEIPRDTCASFEFYRAKEVIETGHETAARVISAKLR